jgi:competence protein ComEC
VLKRPLFLVAIAFIAGIIISGVFHLPIAIAVAGLVFGGLCSAVYKYFGVALLFVIAIMGLLCYESHMFLPPDDVSHFIRSGVSAVYGRVTSDIDLREDRAMFAFDVNSVEVAGRRIPASGTLMVSGYKPTNRPDWDPPKYGDVLLIRTRVSRPAKPSNPGAFSWAEYLARKKIYAVTYIRRPGQVKVLKNDPPNLVVALALSIRQWMIDSIGRSMPPDEGSVVAGMALGTYTTLPDRLLANFQRTGTLHLLAASGFNCAMLVVFFGFILARFLKLPKKTVHLLLIGILFVYMLMVGATPSIVRATVMASLLLIGALVNRPSDVINLMFAAALVILAINPADIFDIGFQLSFAAVMALIMVMPLIETVDKKWIVQSGKYRGWKIRLPFFLMREGWQGFTVTVAATLGTIPLSVNYFNQLSLVSFIVNAIVAATVLPITIIGLLLPIFASIPVIGDLLVFVGTWTTRFALATINWFGELPHSCLSVVSPGAIGVIGYYFLLSAGLYYAYSRLIGNKRTDNS